MAWTGGQGEERDVKTLNGVAEATIAKYTIVSNGTATDGIINAAGGTVFPLGVAGNGSENGADGYSTTNKQMAVKYSGIVFVKMAGAGVRGDRVMSNASGEGIRHDGTDGVYVLGFATKAWADGDVIPVIIDRFFVGDHTSS
jgi:hypothetical protein